MIPQGYDQYGKGYSQPQMPYQQQQPTRSPLYQTPTQQGGPSQYPPHTQRAPMGQQPGGSHYSHPHQHPQSMKMPEMSMSGMQQPQHSKMQIPTGSHGMPPHSGGMSHPQMMHGQPSGPSRPSGHHHSLSNAPPTQYDKYQRPQTMPPQHAQMSSQMPNPSLQKPPQMQPQPQPQQLQPPQQTQKPPVKQYPMPTPNTKPVPTDYMKKPMPSVQMSATPSTMQPVTTKNPAVPGTSGEQDRWLHLENNEVYVIRPDSLKKSYDLMLYKLQRERTNPKRANPPTGQELEENYRLADTISIKKSFNESKDLYSDLLGVKKLIKRYNEKMASKFDRINKEVKLANVDSIKEKDFYKYYWVDIMKRKRQANDLKDEPLF